MNLLQCSLGESTVYSKVMKPVMCCRCRMGSGTGAAEHSGHYLIHFSLIDKISHPRPTQPRKCKHKCERSERQTHLFPIPDVKCMAVIHRKLDTVQLHLRVPPSLLVIKHPSAVSQRVLRTTAVLTGDERAASGCTCAPITACLIFFLFFAVFLPAQRQQLC